jgi:hypothetical protein
MIGGFFVFPCQAARGPPDRNEKINNGPSGTNKMKDRPEQWAKKMSVAIPSADSALLVGWGRIL